jgi:hypothetical protein
MKSLLVLVAAMATLPLVAQAQRQEDWREDTVVVVPPGEWGGPRTPDGQPDVAGHWSNTIGNHNTLHGRVSDPVDGIPYRPWAKAKQEEFKAHLEDPTRPEYVEPLARCAPAGPTKSFLWHGFEIRQFPGYVLFLFDSGTRVIRLGEGSRLPETLKLWNGDSYGHWEGNTLFVDVSNNNSKARFARTGEFVSDQAHVAERFTFDSTRERFTYHATYTDPVTLIRPFTVTIPVRRITADTPQDGWNNITFRVIFPANVTEQSPDIETYERTCVENNGQHGDIVRTTEQHEH